MCKRTELAAEARLELELANDMFGRLILIGVNKSWTPLEVVRCFPRGESSRKRLVHRQIFARSFPCLFFLE